MDGSPSKPVGLAARLAAGVDLPAALAGLEEFEIVSEADALALASAVARLTPEEAARRGTSGESTLRRLAVLFGWVASQEAFDVLRAEGVPPLLRLVDDRLAAGTDSTDDEDDVLLALQAAAALRGPGVVERVAAAARAPLSREPMGLTWWALLSAFDPTHPDRVRLARALAEPPPDGPAGLAYLAFANALCRDGSLGAHPFDTPPGVARLLALLDDPEATPRTYLTASQAIGFLSPPGRDDLLARAAAHHDPRVGVEALRLQARRGEVGAVDALVEKARDPRVARLAAAALAQLGQGGRAPSLAPEAKAEADLAHWLAHPAEFDRPPDAVWVIDTRSLRWPPTGDARRLWLLGYRYDRPPWGGGPFEGFGLVGSTTFSRVGDPIAGRPADDLYALHCCWELQLRHDPRAPAEATVEAGRALLSG